MSERISYPESHNQIPTPEKFSEKQEKPAEIDPAVKKHTAESISELRQEVAHEAAPKAETTSRQSEKTKQPAAAYLDRKIRAQKFEETMAVTRKRLSKPEAAFSKLIHQPTVERVSEAAGQTVGRPSALLGGGVFASIGLILISWYAKHNGFALSGFEFILLVIGGMLVGVIIEFAGRFIRKIFS